MPPYWRNMYNAYQLNLKDENKQKVSVKLRLTLGGQKALKKKYDEPAMTTLLNAVQDAEIMVDVFNEALNYKNAENTITDGEELYDLLVDNDYKGIEAFTEIMMGIGEASGLFSKKQAESVIAASKGLVERAIEDEEVKNP